MSSLWTQTYAMPFRQCTPAGDVAWHTMQCLCTPKVAQSYCRLCLQNTLLRHQAVCRIHELTIACWFLFSYRTTPAICISQRLKAHTTHLRDTSASYISCPLTIPCTQLCTICCYMFAGKDSDADNKLRLSLYQQDDVICVQPLHASGQYLA